MIKKEGILFIVYIYYVYVIVLCNTEDWFFLWFSNEVKILSLSKLRLSTTLRLNEKDYT